MAKGFRTAQGRRGRTRSVLAGLGVVAVVAWIAGLIVFVETVPRDAEDSAASTDAIVVLTGGTLRLERGLQLLGQQRAAKLFVSGVHRGVDVQQLLRLSRQSPQALDCCITLGYSADHTAGNARETAEWMQEEGLKSLRLVTANYHMPRSLIEFTQAMPEVVILPHPVFPENVKMDAWWRWPGTASLIVGEYNKYLVAMLRHWFQNIVGSVGG